MPRATLLLLLAGVLSAASGLSGATPLPVGPSLLQDSAPVAVIDGGESLVDDEPLNDVLLDDRVADGLIASERRVRAKQQGGAASSTRSISAAQASLPVAGAGGDPLAQTLRQFVAAGPKGTRPVPTSAAASKAPAVALVQDFADGSEAGFLALDEEAQAEVRARLAAAKQGLASVAGWIVTPELDEQGRAGFSVLGLSGFRVESAAGLTSVSFRELSFNAMPVHAADPARGGGGRGQAGWNDEAERDALARLLFLLWDMATHPITLILVTVAALFRLATALASRGPAY